MTTLALCLAILILTLFTVGSVGALWEAIRRIDQQLKGRWVDRTWQCGCGEWNGINLATCARCNRKRGEMK